MFKTLLGSSRKRTARLDPSTPSSNPIADPRSALQSQLPDATSEELDLVLAARANTMTSPERIIGLVRAIDYVVRSGIRGDFVECGVWRGGSMFVAARALLERKAADQHFAERNLWLYDTFEGMSEPTAADVDLQGQAAEHLLRVHSPEDRNGVWCLSRLEEVQRTMAMSTFPSERIRFVQGKVEDTLPQTRPESIALLRLDTDWYESTRCELEFLFPLLAPGGVLIVDDYGHWQGCRQAVDDYFAATGQLIHLARMDYTGRIGIKLGSLSKQN
ncbi:MAG: TylF/MycF/NovP-related O-methyltransferase [Planctomycetota bacterium]